MIRFDKIKNMELGELADYLDKTLNAPCSVCAYDEDDWHCCNNCKGCAEGIRLWLEGEDGESDENYSD